MVNFTRPSKQCEFCNYLFYQSLISQDCQSGLIGQSGRGGPGGLGGQVCLGGQGGPGDQVCQCIYGLNCINNQIIEKT